MVKFLFTATNWREKDGEKVRWWLTDAAVKSAGGENENPSALVKATPTTTYGFI